MGRLIPSITSSHSRPSHLNTSLSLYHPYSPRTLLVLLHQEISNNFPRYKPFLQDPFPHSLQRLRGLYSLWHVETIVRSSPHYGMPASWQCRWRYRIDRYFYSTPESGGHNRYRWQSDVPATKVPIACLPEKNYLS